MNEKNNFDAVRIGLALSVVFVHLYSLTELSSFQFLTVIFDSNFAVKGFFVISGFLVTKSYLSSKTLYTYFEKRIRRIYPAYLIAILLCFLIGIFTTKLSFSEFLYSKDTLKYLVANAIFLNFLHPTLPFVFDTNPLQAMNGSLWTIKIEVMLYVCLPMIIALFIRFGAFKITLILFTASIIWVYFFNTIYQGRAGAEIARQFPGQLSYFLLGAFLAYTHGHSAKLKWLSLASLFLLYFIAHPTARLVIEPIAYASIVMFLSLEAVKSLKLGRYGDISYGIYLYHFPLIQLLIALKIFDLNIWVGFTLTFICTLSLAFLSWHLIEKRLLKRNSQ